MITDCALGTWMEAVPTLRSGYVQALLLQVEALRETSTIYPPQERVLYALEATDLPGTRVVVVGQDPYHGPQQADGLAFSVPVGLKAPPSLRNILREVSDDVYGGRPPAVSTDLAGWARQGVLLLNVTLTVEAGRPGSHRHLGWERLTDEVIAAVSASRPHTVFMLWGSAAQSKRALIDAARHLILEAPHPSPLSAYRGFLGCRHFTQANRFLAQHGLDPIVW